MLRDSAIRDDQGGNEAHNITVVDDGGYDRSEIIAAITYHYRARIVWLTAQTAMTLRCSALCRSLCDGDKKEAEKLLKAVMGKSDHPKKEDALFACLPILKARDGLSAHVKRVDKILEGYAKQLPVCEFVENTRGFAYLSLAKIIGETGDLSNYATVSRLWKRMGLAPYQNAAGSTWKVQSWRSRALTAQEWVDMGYAQKRRATAYQVGTGLLMGKNETYRAIYDERKAYELPRVETLIHAHKRAKRYMEKRFLLDLWKAWRGQSPDDTHTGGAAPKLH